MDAKAARNLAKASVSEEIDQVLEEIRIACTKGHIKLIFNTMSEACKAYLEDSGYKVFSKSNSQHNYIEVCW